MSRRTLDFWFDYSCPFAYLASTQIEALAGRIDAALSWRPMLLGGVFKAVGTPQNLMNLLTPAKASHNEQDMLRWAAFFNVDLKIPAGHPLRTVEALRATLASGIDPRVVHGFFRAYWVEGRAISEPETLRAVLTGAGHDASAILARLGDDAIKDDLRSRTEQAVALGIFGAPSFVLDGSELYWGQDRMVQIEGRGVTRASDAATAPAKPSGRTLEVFWDFSSPFAYLGSTQAEALARRTGAQLTWRPMLLGGLFKSIGQVDIPMASWSDAKRNYVMKDMERWAAYWGVPFKFPTRFPMNTVKALRVYLALSEERRAAFREATFRAYWAEDRDINDDAELRALIGPDADEVLARTKDSAIKQALIDATERASRLGVFGAPTWMIDGSEVFWGQDRIALVERALTR